MATFVQQYAALRWSVVAAFLIAAAMVLVRLVTPDPALHAAGGHPAAPQRFPAPGQRESDAAHLIMCLVMLTMLVFPAGANAHAMRGVLTAMTVVFAALLLLRMTEGGNDIREDGHHRRALGYHVVAAGAMLYAMSGHSDAGHTAASPVPAFAAAALFAVDALVTVVALAGRRYRLGHPLGFGDAPPTAVVPHLVMAVGMAYMLVGAALG